MKTHSLGFGISVTDMLKINEIFFRLRLIKMTLIVTITFLTSQMIYIITFGATPSSIISATILTLALLLFAALKKKISLLSPEQATIILNIITSEESSLGILKKLRIESCDPELFDKGVLLAKERLALIGTNKTGKRIKTTYHCFYLDRFVSKATKLHSSSLSRQHTIC